MSTPDRDPGADLAALRELRKRSRRGFVTAGIAAVGAFGGLKLLANGGLVDGLPKGLREVLRLNERIARATFDPRRLSKEYPADQAREPRVNGDVGLPEEYATTPDAAERDAWRVVVESPRGRATLTLADIAKCRRVDLTTELRCVEGWTQVVNWGGARLSELADMTGLARRSDQPGDLYDYVALETPGAEYYVGIDAPSAFHAQTIVADAMNGKSLTHGHGGPLRLAIPTKYGVKNLKRIALIRFGDDRPRDYWAERGYDWYCGF